jgi:valyl-tRNA synthetase
LVTGFDIIFFWVARMMMMGLHFMKEVPFSKIYIHALVRDEKGHKMSKTKGNVLDPLSLCDEYGADALRFTLAFLAVPGRDVRISVAKVESSRNFITKLWNASRYAQMSGCVLNDSFDPVKVQHNLNRWIFSELIILNEKIEKAMVEFKFNEVASLLYQFVWGTLCDWYLEFTKPLLQTDAAGETKDMIAYILKNVYTLMSPLTPHICEELWASLSNGKGDLLIKAPWPVFDQKHIDQNALLEIQTLIEIITSIRSARSELNVPASKEIPLKVITPTSKIHALCEGFELLIKKLGRLSNIDFENKTIDLKGCASFVVGDVRFALLLTDIIDFETEKQRLSKEIGKLGKELTGFNAKLDNPAYLANAPEDVVEETKEKALGIVSKIEKLKSALSLLG